MKSKISYKRPQIILVIILILLTSNIYSQNNITASVIGRNIVSSQEINQDGLNIEIELKGANLKKDLTQEDKDKIAQNLFVDLDDGQIFDGERGNLDRLEVIKTSREEFLVSIGNDSTGKPIDSIDRFLSFKESIPEEVKKNGQIYINGVGNLVIKCNSPYFKNLKNNIVYTQGGVPLAWGDIPIYPLVPKEIIENGIEDIRTSNFYAIIEMKARVEILEYDDLSAKRDKDLSRTHVVEHVTAEDIRTGGKLLKVTVDSRNGPTKWTIETKRDPTFIANMFRTNRTSGEGQDDPNWKMIESALGSELSYGDSSLTNWNGYWVSEIEDNRMETSLEDLKEMYYILEFPVVKDFDIAEDMNVYINLLSGMIGGSGKSGKQATPYWGQDGRLSFTILVGDHDKENEMKKDNAGNNLGFEAGSGDGFGNETGTGSGSQGENTQLKSVEINNSVKPSNSDENKSPKSAKEAKDMKSKEDLEEKSQGSSGEGKNDKTPPKEVYEVSDEDLQESVIERKDYDYPKFFVFLFIIITIGALHRYYKFSRFIR